MESENNETDIKSEQVLEALNLNDKQREAVLINDNPLLILAGAGSGKTRTIISKIAYDIIVLGVDPHNILAVTFTNKAADEMRNRLSLYLGDSKASEVDIKTFHSFGAAFLRTYANKIGLNPAFNIYDDKDAVQLLKTKYPDSKSKELKPVVDNILAAKERGYDVNNYLEYFDSHQDVYNYFKVYDALLRESGNVDLPELILLPTKVLSSNTEIREDVQHRYKRIFVDEYQDTNGAQFAFLKCLVGKDNIICVVGDDDQSIYGFRGSEVQHILEFADFFKGAKTVKLEENYRSSSSIIALAASLIKNNKERHEKTLWTNNPKGEKPKFYIFDNENEEARFVANEIQKEPNIESVAILYRTNAQSAAFERVLLEKKIPYHVLRGNSFYERADTKDAVALMAFAINPSDVIAFMRVINKPSRALGDTAQNTIIEYARSLYGGNILEALKTVKLPTRARKGATEFVNSIERARSLLGKDTNGEFLRVLLLESGLYGYYVELDEKEANTTDTHQGALDALINQVDSFEKGESGIIALMEQMILVSQQDVKNTEGVALSTVHGVKGLEFDKVYITGIENGLFPLSRTESKEEERRLMYVAITRARKELCLTAVLSRLRYGSRERTKISPYVFELDKNNYSVENRSTFSSDAVKTSFLRIDTFEGNSSEGTSYNNTQKLYGNYKKPYWSSYSGPSVLDNLKRASELESRGEIPKAPASREASAEEQKSLPFKKGDRVRLFDLGYGKGVVSSVRLLKGRYVMDVVFDNGRKSTFPVYNTKVDKIV